MAELNDAAVAQLGRKLVNIIDGLLEKGDWDASLFLRTSKKRLEELRAEACKVSTGVTNDQSQSFVLFKKPPAPGSVQIFISVYQFAAKSLNDWQSSLKSLVGHSVTRPAYRNEEEVQKSIRTSADINRYGYAIVNVKESDIYKVDPVPVDALGTPILTLAENAIKLENIVGFVHANKERYSFQDGKLVLEE